MKIVVSDTPPYFLGLNAPTLPAFECKVDGRILWRVWCKDCKRFHYHGPGEGHRIAHCRKPGSPYAANGYNLALAHYLDRVP